MAGVVVVGPQLVEERVRSAPGHRAEQLRELERLVLALGVLPAHGVGVHDRRGDGEQLGADVHYAPEERLPTLELRLPARHAVEGRARELARGTLDVAQVARQRSELVVGARILAL